MVAQVFENKRTFGLKSVCILILLSLSAMLLPLSCTVISQPVRKEAEAPVPFKTLLAESDNHIGRTVILGGYILDTINLESVTIIRSCRFPSDPVKNLI